MTGLSSGTSRGFIMAIVGVICATMLAPVTALADTNLEVGGEAIVAYANGDNVRFRDEPSKSGSVISLIPEGTLVDVFYGPIEADDGSMWYNVGVDGEPGYIVADFLAVPSSDGAAIPANATVLDAEGSESADGIAEGAVVSLAVIAGTNGDGVRCRADASSGAAIITVLPEGTTVELTGDPIDVWQPVNCAGQGGFVHTDFVSYDGSGAGADVAEPQAAEDVAQEFGAASVTGAATVVGTNGGGLRCRAKANTDADVLMTLKEGASVELRGDASGSWQPVFCGGNSGYVHVDYLAYDGGSGGGDASGDDSGGGAGASTGLATIGDTQGDGLRCRSDASYDASVIVVLGEGTTVELTGDADGAWQPVNCGGSSGFVHSDYLIYDGGSGGDDTGTAGEDSGGDSVTGSATVGDTQGGGLRCRASASFDANILTVLSEGTEVDLRGDANGDWQPIFCDGEMGWVHADYLSYGGSSGDGGGSGGSSGGSNAGFGSGDVVEVSGTNGDGVRFRSDASYDASVISVLSEGTVLDVVGGSTGDWVAVSRNGTEGFIHMDYLVASDGSSGGGGGDDSGGDSGGSGSGLAAGDSAVTLSNLNLRYDPSMSAGVAAVAPEGTVVEIVGGPDNGFYEVDWDGLGGFMHSDYLSWTDEAPSDRGGSGQSGGDGGGVSGGGGGGDDSGAGSAIANFAMQYLGYPYVWATHGPSSFDCSGFTYWVVLNTLGIDIGTGTWTQVSAGTTVSRDELQPGDLVFFQNTYTWGLSHVGIYIGGGQFIHAENESTGVKISDLSSSYYSSRWYGAVRLA